MTDPDPLADWRSNPFFVLEIPIDATPSEVERAGQKLRALMAIGSAGVEHYASPLGIGPRDPDKVRQALAALRDPNERVLRELWANIAQEIGGEQPKTGGEGCETAERVLGWPKAWKG
jgi:hypothetical protein